MKLGKMSHIQVTVDWARIMLKSHPETMKGAFSKNGKALTVKQSLDYLDRLGMSDCELVPCCKNVDSKGNCLGVIDSKGNCLGVIDKT